MKQNNNSKKTEIEKEKKKDKERKKERKKERTPEKKNSVNYLLFLSLRLLCLVVRHHPIYLFVPLIGS